MGRPDMDIDVDGAAPPATGSPTRTLSSGSIPSISSSSNTSTGTTSSRKAPAVMTIDMTGSVRSSNNSISTDDLSTSSSSINNSDGDGDNINVNKKNGNDNEEGDGAVIDAVTITVTKDRQHVEEATYGTRKIPSVTTALSHLFSKTLHRPSRKATSDPGPAATEPAGGGASSLPPPPLPPTTTSPTKTSSATKDIGDDIRKSTSTMLTSMSSSALSSTSDEGEESRPLQSQHRARQVMEMESITVGYTIEDGLTSPMSQDNDDYEGQEMVYDEVLRRRLTRRRRRRKMLFILSAILVVLILFVVVPSTVTTSNKSTIEASTSASAVDDGGDNVGSDGQNGAFIPSTSSGSGSLGGRLTSQPFSIMDPVTDLGLVGYNKRPDTFMPSSRLDPLKANRNNNGQRNRRRASTSSPYNILPTNSWYQNLLTLKPNQRPTNSNKVYTIPYVIDVATTTATATSTAQVVIHDGIRVHPTRLSADTTQVSVTVDESYALYMGLGAPASGSETNTTSSSSSSSSSGYNNDFSVVSATELSITLQWNKNIPTDAGAMKTKTMTTTLTRGMPYVTMIYNDNEDGSTATFDGSSFPLLPTLQIGVPLREPPIIDRSSTATPANFCSSTSTGGDGTATSTVTVQSELEFAITNGNKNQRWLVFFSRPVQLMCNTDSGTTFQVLEDSSSSSPLVVRAALVVDDVNSAGDTNFEDGYKAMLRSGANLYPGMNSKVEYTFITTASSSATNADEGPDRARISFDWDAQYMWNTGGGGDQQQPPDKMVMYALPHHQDILESSINSTQVLSNFCTPSLLGRACIVESPVSSAVSTAQWNMYEDLPPVGLRASRQPQPRLVPALADALMDDISYQIPKNFQIGAGDTYFSGKTIARLARILLIHEELAEICSSASAEYAGVCSQVTFPSADEVTAALEQLRSVVTVWVKDNQQAPFVYDTTWGGTVSCGCVYQNGVCANAVAGGSTSTNSTIVNCPSFTDPGLNFGNGVYNDHHFHYGYLVYASAVLSHFDPQWGVNHFDHVLLLIRDFANPSEGDNAYPVFRHKDWYKGHSWASGLVDPVFVNIMNQESSSEAIAAYEAVALYGRVMSKNFQTLQVADKLIVAKNIQDVGLLLTATELRSTQKYWQIYNGGNDSSYPSQPYEAGVVGILWETMIQFTTWFGNSPYLIYGIQLLPITPISEQRDSPQWAQAIYGRLSQSCDATCVSEGWSVQIFALLATLGKIDEAIELTNNLSPSVYLGPGGNGHSKSNTIWYIATRQPTTTDSDAALFDIPAFPEIEFVDITCGQPTVCNADVLDGLAGDFTCRSRIEWVMNNAGLSEAASCARVAGEFTECQTCNPSGDVISKGNNETDGLVSEETSGEGGGGTADVVEMPTITLTCFQPVSCTSTVLSRMAGGVSCKDRIEFLIDSRGQSESNACRQVSSVEFPDECGPCAPPTSVSAGGGQQRRQLRQHHHEEYQRSSIRRRFIE